MFLIVITDPANVATLDRELVRRLNARHEQMYILVEDSPLTNNKLLKHSVDDMSDHVRLPHYFRANKKVAKAEEDYRNELYGKIQKNLRHFGIVSTFVDGKDRAIPQVFKMLEEQKHVRR